jgi:hypothetical protein
MKSYKQLKSNKIVSKRRVQNFKDGSSLIMHPDGKIEIIENVVERLFSKRNVN